MCIKKLKEELLMFKSKEEKQREAELEAQRLEKEKIEKAEKEIA